ncbi:futalosine hydrolase [Yinghuangia sp. ASG 101]|uniref:futalosine hydrolase n=1 Tax=Yinghuangia sp. ASG 101 TaxID=2896848 RepID=UPI001E294D84|nr:futalosine hydrolase [Yinghuangia sp. ASG 101]UGQ14801.1 futalosine hydrolase [Yinghuangia sp. ASG 101]
MRVLVVTAVAAERDAVLGHGPLPGVDVLAAGVGPASAAAGTAAALARSAYGLVVSAGIGGGFAGVAALGSLVVAGRIVAADLGAETPDGFLTIDELGFGAGVFAVDPTVAARAADAARTVVPDVVVGPVLTVSTATGTASRATALTTRHPGAAAEGMEGFGVAAAAAGAGVPVCELRAVSNVVGPRDRDAWRIPDALRVLGAAAAAVLPALREERA